MKIEVDMRVLLILISFSSFCIGEILIVDINGNGDYSDIQSALDAAKDGDQVLVEPGEYEIAEMLNFNRFINIRDPDNPDNPPVKNLTLKSRKGPYETIIRMKDKKYSVIGFLSGESEDSILDGFTITGGSGRAMYYEPDHTLHTFDLGGGGILIQFSSPTIKNCIITGNFCRDEENIGAGILTSGASPTITNCIITKNSTALITPFGVRSGGLGGGFASSSSTSKPVYTNCIITHNEAPRLGWGAAGYISYGSEVTMNNCLIADNISYFAVGGILCEHLGILNLNNCTIAGNTTYDVGFYYYAGIILRNSSIANITNSIIWGNRQRSIFVTYSSSFTSRYSCIDDYGVWPGEGNTDADPLFVNPEEGDYRLRPDSPVINAGIVEVGLNPEVDLEGNPRSCWNGIDMGAYEYCGEEMPGPLTRFRRGDVNIDERMNIADAINILEFLFLKDKTPPCLNALDANDDGKIDLADPLAILGYILAGTASLPPPFYSCGEDPTWDGISCKQFFLCD